MYQTSTVVPKGNQYYSGHEANRCYFFMQVVGLGVVRVKPEAAVLKLGAFTESTSVTEAQRSNSEKINAVIRALLSMGIDRRDIQTLEINIEPTYDFIEGRQILKGFRVTNMLKVTVKDIENTGEIIDAAAANGANLIRDIDFTVTDLTRHYRSALTLAAFDTLDKAKTISSAYKAVLYETPVAVVEESLEQSLSQSVSAFKAADASTPVEPGEVAVKASVRATFAYWR